MEWHTAVKKGFPANWSSMGFPAADESSNWRISGVLPGSGINQIWSASVFAKFIHESF
jgi:hypothetical protein